MTSLTYQKILNKLDNFQEYLGYLHQLREEIKDEKVFLSDFRLFGNTERYLQLSIQTIIDIFHLIIIDLDLKRPEDNYDAISILFGKKIISEELSQKITKMIGLRNLLVHEYGEVDRKIIFKILSENLEDLELFKKEISNFIKNK
jgi:uncharacterized protein YutE (UPF0331/DUF86 family)